MFPQHKVSPLLHSACLTWPTVQMAIKTKHVCALTAYVELSARTHFQCLWISQHAHYSLLPGWHHRDLCHTWLQLFVIFSSCGQRIFICRGAVAAEPFPNVNSQPATGEAH